MRKFYMKRAKCALSVLGIGAMSFFLQEAKSQATTCNTFNQSCADFGATTIDFNSNANQFTSSGGITYNSGAGNFSGAIAPSGTVNFVINTRQFDILNSTLAVGFTTSQTTAGLITSYMIETVRVSDNTVLATCTTPSPTVGPFCYSIGDADQVPGTDVFFRITISATNATGSSQTATFDDFTFRADQVAVILPVSLTSFTANRIGSAVKLKWTTATESNNSGFEIERKGKKEARFGKVNFVASKSLDGNSGAVLQYEFTDNNPAADLSYYRIKQVDKDGKFKLSEIRLVNGIKNKGGFLIYPNPSKSSTVTVSFSSDEERNIQLTDVNGRTLRSWKSFKNQVLKLADLNTGIYLLRVHTPASNENVIEKIVVTQ